MAPVKPKPWPTAVKCKTCAGRGVKHTRSVMSGVPCGSWHAKPCSRCWSVGWKSATPTTEKA